MNGRTTVATAVLIAAVATLTSCARTAGDDADPRPTPTPAVSSSGPHMPDLDQFTPPPAGAIDDDTGEVVTPQPVPEWDPASRAAATDAATAVVTAFVRPEQPYEAWWAGVEPLLTPQAAQDYAYVDPANIAPSAITGPAVIVDDTSAYVAGIEVPTTLGPYTVVLSRTDAAGAWLAVQITPPEGAK